MQRNPSAITRIHDPPDPPCWFRTTFYTSFCAWVLMQAAAEYYSIKSLTTYTHLPLFENEKSVDAAYLSVVSVGILTALLVLTFLCGIVTKNKLVIMASASFLISLLILNVLAVANLMTSRFNLNLGPIRFHQRVLTIHHPNVSEEHWFAEITSWAQVFPATGNDSGSGLPPPNSTIGPSVSEFNIKGTTTEIGNKTEATAKSARVNDDEYDGGGVGNSTTHLPSFSSEMYATTGNDTTTFSTTSAGSTDGSLTLRQLVRQAEYRHLYLLSFFQTNAFCCGVNSAKDYSKHKAQTPVSCRCQDGVYKDLVRPLCSANAHPFADGITSAVWSRGCQTVIDMFMTDLYHVRDLLLATVAFQLLVSFLGLVLGCNTPSSKTDDGDGDESVY